MKFPTATISLMCAVMMMIAAIYAKYVDDIDAGFFSTLFFWIFIALAAVRIFMNFCKERS